MAAPVVDSITLVGAATKVSFNDGRIEYHWADGKIDINGDTITIEAKFLSPSKSSRSLIVSYAGLNDNYGTSTAEEYVDYLLTNSFFLPKFISQSKAFATKVTVVGSITYLAIAEPGSLQADAVWQAQKIDETSGTIITWADKAQFNQVATDLTTLTYT